MTFPAVLVRRTISGFLYFQIMGNFVVRRFWRLNGILYPKEEKRLTAQIWGSGDK